MNASEIRPDQAAAALAEIRAQQERVFATSPFPRWYWPTVGALQIVFAVGIESRRPKLVAAATVLFVLGITGAIALMAVRGRMSTRNELIGQRGAVAIVTFVMFNLALGLGTGFGLAGLGVEYAGAIGSIVVAVAMTAFGPVLGRKLQRIMKENAIRSLG